MASKSPISFLLHDVAEIYFQIDIVRLIESCCIVLLSYRCVEARNIQSLTATPTVVVDFSRAPAPGGQATTFRSEPVWHDDCRFSRGHGGMLGWVFDGVWLLVYPVRGQNMFKSFQKPIRNVYKTTIWNKIQKTSKAKLQSFASAGGQEGHGKAPEPRRSFPRHWYRGRFHWRSDCEGIMVTSDCRPRNIG